MFAETILGINHMSACRIRRVYQLDHLLHPHFEFKTDADDRIAHIQLTHMRVSHRSAKPNGRYKELGFGRDESLAQIRDSVGFRLQFRSRNNARARSLSFHVSAPNTCDLKEKPEDLRLVGEHCLRLWSITND